MDSLKFSIVKNSRSKEIIKVAITITSVVSLIFLLIAAKNIFTLTPIIIVFSSLAFIIGYAIFYDSFKTYNIMGYIELGSNFISITNKSECQAHKIKDINYIDFEYEGYTGSNHPLAAFSRSIVSKDGTGNILEIGTNPTGYKVNCLLENESQAVLLRNYVTKFNKSKQNNNR